MWFRDEEADIAFSKEEGAFVALVWHELFGETTPDSFRPRILDTPALLKELETVSKKAEQNDGLKKHSEQICRELQTVARRDVVLERKFPKVHVSIQQIDASDHPHHYSSRVLQDELDDYETAWFQELNDACDQLPKEKARTKRALGHIATRAQQKGLPREYCRNLIETSAFEAPSDEVIRSLAAGINRAPKEWKCIVCVDGDRSDLQSVLSKTDLSLLSGAEKPLGDLGTEFLEATESFERCVDTINKKNPRAAAGDAASKLRRALDLTNFYNRIQKLTISPLAFAEGTEDREQHRIRLDAGAESNFKPKADAIEECKAALSEQLLARSPNRIASALEQYSLAIGTTELRVRFLNLWVALETLLGLEGQSIGGRIRRVLAPVIVGRRTNKIIKYLAISLHKFGLCRGKGDANGWFSESTDRHIRPDELFLLLSRNDLEEEKRRLFEITAEHPLLCNRLFTVHKEISSPANLESALVDSLQRVQWQIHRLYRARNFIAHEAQQMDSLGLLLDNLHYYFIVAVERILEDLRTHSEWTPDETLEQRRQHLDYVITLLKRQEQESLTVYDFIDGQGAYEMAPIWN